MCFAACLRWPVAVGLFITASLLAFWPASAGAQQPAPAEMGKIHGRVINPVGQPQKGGTVSLSTDEGATLSYNFPVSESGEYAGSVPAGEYMVIYRAADTPEGKVVDYIREVVVTAGQDTAQDIDMTRDEFMVRLPPEQRTQYEQMRKANSAVAATNEAVTGINADLEKVNHDLEDIANARETMAKDLGAGATAAEIDAKTIEFTDAKYTEIETVMKKDAALKPDEPVILIDLARAQAGLKEFLEAETNYKRALDVATRIEPPQPILVGAADSGLGEVYARSLMVDEANAAYDAAAKADPENAATYLADQAIVFSQEKNYRAQVDAADEAIKAAPGNALLYYIKARGLSHDLPIDPDTGKFMLSTEAMAAYRKYLELDPNGPHADEVKSILRQAEEKSSTPAAPPPANPPQP